MNYSRERNVSIKKKLDQRKSKYKLKKSMKRERKSIQLANERFSAVDEFDVYPMMSEENLLPWQMFTRDFHSRDLPFDQVVKNIINDYPDELLDFRPYMIENPITVSTNDYFQKCCDQFRLMHLRSLIVIDPLDAKLKGIITRQDLF